MSITNYFAISIAILAVIALLCVFVYYRYIKTKHTREKFAFVALSVYTVFLVTIISLLFAPNILFEWLVQAINNQFGWSLPAYQQASDFTNIFVLLIAAFFVFMMIRSLYFGWNGKKSTRQIDKEETKSKIGMYDDFWFYLKRRNELEIYIEDKEEKQEIFSETIEDTRPFYIKAATLLKLYDQQYEIDLEKDWHREYHAFIGRYAANNSKIGVLCFDKLPTDEVINKYLKRYEKDTFEKHILVIEGKGIRETKIYGTTAFDIRYENELLDSLINFSDYKKFITRSFDENTLPNSDLTLADIYTPLKGEVKTIKNEQLVTKHKIKNIEKHVLHWINNSNEKEHLVVLGDYGQGKTVLTQKIVKEILENPTEYQRIPILIELRGISPRNNEDIDLLGKWANRHQCKAEAVLELHKAGKLLVILDGFDEMDLVADTELLFNHFNEIWALAKYPNAKIMVTGRPNLFSDDIERRDALGILPKRVTLPYSNALFLSPMTNKQIELALRNVKETTKNEILEQLAATNGEGTFSELLKRPSTLYQLSTVWDDELAKYKDRLNSAVVIKHFLDKTYERQDSKAANVLTTHERNYFMMGIAVGMMLNNQYSNQIRYKDLQDLIKQLWNNYPDKLMPYKDAQQGNKQKEFLKNRLKENQKALAIVERDVCAGGILVQDLSGRDTFRFAHKSYMEYLVSAFYVGFLLKKENDKNELMVINSIAQTFNFKQTQLAPSKDVERFAAEQIVGSIELKDEANNIIPQKGNEKEYLKEIYKKVIPHWYSRLFPNITGWLSLHPALNYFILIFIISLISLIIILQTKNIILKESLGYLNIVLLLSIYSIIFIYKLHSSEKIIERKKSSGSNYITYVRLYGQSSELLNQKIYPIKKTFYQLISLEKEHELYRSIIINIVYIVLVGGIGVGGIGVGVGVGVGRVVAGAGAGVIGAVVGRVVAAGEEKEKEKEKLLLVALLLALLLVGGVVGGGVVGVVGVGGGVIVVVVGVVVIVKRLRKNLQNMNNLNKIN